MNTWRKMPCRRYWEFDVLLVDHTGRLAWCPTSGWVDTHQVYTNRSYRVPTETDLINSGIVTEAKNDPSIKR